MRIALLTIDVREDHRSMGKGQMMQIAALSLGLRDAPRGTSYPETFLGRMRELGFGVEDRIGLFIFRGAKRNDHRPAQH